LRTAHYITIAAALGIIALLYFGINTTPPVKKGEQPAQQGMAQGQHSDIKAASLDSILSASKAALPEHAKAEIGGLEQKISNIKDSAAMGGSYAELAKLWQEHKNIPLAAYYYGLSGKLEKSEKNLNFAGQIFLDLVHNAASPGMQMWEAEQSIACFRQSLEINPNNDTVKMALAAAYIEGAGQTMQGVQLLLGITREKPDNIPANMMLGRLAIQSGQFDKAIGRFEGILKQDPKNTEAMYFLAEAYKGKGDKTKAIELFEACKKLVNKPEFSNEIDNYINSFK
jgi:tetratricopeptide (TPR) repeat protein